MCGKNSKISSVWAVTLFSALVGLGNLAARADSVSNGSFEQPTVGGGFDGSQPTGWDVLGDVPNAQPIVGSSSSIDHIGTYWQAAEGKQSLDLNGVSYGVIGQTLNNIVAGQRYQLTFEMSGNPDNGPTLKSLEVDLFSLATTPVPSAVPFVPTNITGGAHSTPDDSDTLATFSSPPPTIISPTLFTYDTSVHNNNEGDMKWVLETLDFVAPSSGDVYLQFTSRTLTSEPGYDNSPWGPALDAVSVVPVPLPASAGVGFSMIAGFGGLTMLRKRFTRRDRIA